MGKPVVEIDNLSKLYKVGTIGASTLKDTVRYGWRRMLGKEDDRRIIGSSQAQIDPSHPQAGPEPNTFWALKDVNLSVNQGEVLGIIGKNGAGKSTLLKILSHITEPTQGRVVIRGRVGSLLEVGTGFHPELTGRENIYLNGAILGMRAAEITRKLDEIIAFSEVEEFIDTPVKRYSSGMYVRLAFSVAAHLDPEVILVDEVLAVGDAAFQKKCLAKLKDVTQSGKTVIFISHYMHVVRSLCQRVALMDHGRLQAGLQMSEAISRYLGIDPEEGAMVAKVRDLPRATGALGQSLVIEAVERVNPEDDEEDSDIRFRLHIEAKRDLSELIAGVYVQTPGIGTVATAQCLLPGVLRQGRSVIEVIIEAYQIAPGNYSVGFILRDRLQDYDDLREFFPLKVEAKHADMGGCEHWHETWGAVRLKARAELTERAGWEAQ